MPNAADLLSSMINPQAPDDQLRDPLGQGQTLTGLAQIPGMGAQAPGAGMPPPGMPSPQPVAPSPNVAGPLAALAKPRLKAKTAFPVLKPKIKLKTPPGTKPKIKLKAAAMGGMGGTS